MGTRKAEENKTGENHVRGNLRRTRDKQYSFGPFYTLKNTYYFIGTAITKLENTSMNIRFPRNGISFKD